MDIILSIIAILAGIIGLLGVIIPVLPGTVLSFGGMMSLYFASCSTITINQLIIWGIISVVVMLMDYILPGYMSKQFGGTKAGVTGATIGTFVGMFFSIVGIIIGPFIGAVVGEIIGSKRPLNEALKVGFGSLLSFIVGSGLKLIVGAMLMYYIVKDVIHIFTTIW